MAVGLSPTLVRKMLSDETFEMGMEALAKSYQDGNRYALFETIAVCAQYQAVLPDWVSTELIQYQNEHFAMHFNKYGKVDPDFNAFFGSTPPQPGSREYNNAQKIKRLTEIEERVVSTLAAHRWEGGSFNVDLGIAEVAQKLGLPRRDVEEIYRQNKGILKNLTRNPEGVEAYANIKCPTYRRTGRPVLDNSTNWSFEEVPPKKDTKS